MISGAPGHRVATINGEPFSEGETHKLTCGQRKLTIQCVEIRDQSVVAKVQGEMHLRQLKVGQLVPLSGD
jgi:membrane-bound inhibitor of C-type lysozyme